MLILWVLLCFFKNLPLTWKQAAPQSGPKCDPVMYWPLAQNGIVTDSLAAKWSTLFTSLAAANFIRQSIGAGPLRSDVNENQNI